MGLIREDFLEAGLFMTAVHSLQEGHVQERGTPTAAPSLRDDDRFMKKSPDEAGEAGQWQQHQPAFPSHSLLGRGGGGAGKTMRQ